MHKSEKKILDGIFRLTLAPSSHFEFSQFLIIDQKTCLIHAGKERLFEPLLEMVQKKLGSRHLDYIVFSHIESDESGAINKWLAHYPNAKVVCNKIANMNLEDFLLRPAQVLNDAEELLLGTKKLKLINTPHFPHNWDAHMWFESTQGILFSSDFCCQGGMSEPVVEHDLSVSIIQFYVNGGFIPYGKSTNDAVKKISVLPIRMIAPMHGSVIVGDVCTKVMRVVGDDLMARAGL
jgi:flavorubredoxin